VEAIEPDAYHHYSQILRKLGKKKEALQYEHKYRDLLELAQNQAVQEFSLNSINAYAISQSYEKINRLYSKPLQQENKWRTIGLTGLGLTLIMGIGIFLLYRQRRLSSRQLQQKQAAILAQKNELEQLNALKIQLFGAIARDLRVPLASIQQVVAGYKSAQSPEEEKAAMDLLREQTDYASARLEEMLQQAKQQMQVETVG
jgi:signal transduction histidine kinase